MSFKTCLNEQFSQKKQVNTNFPFSFKQTPKIKDRQDMHEIRPEKCLRKNSIVFKSSFKQTPNINGRKELKELDQKNN